VGQRLRETAVVPPDSGPLTAARMAVALRTRPSDRGPRPAGGPGISNAALARQAGRVQSKLAVSQVDDPLEREAEAFSARVVAQGPQRRAAPVADAPGSTTAAATRLAVVRRVEVRSVDSGPPQSEAPAVRGSAREESDARQRRISGDPRTGTDAPS
jgi:hypothetical protein